MLFSIFNVFCGLELKPDHDTITYTRYLAHINGTIKVLHAISRAVRVLSERELRRGVADRVAWLKFQSSKLENEKQHNLHI